MEKNIVEALEGHDVDFLQSKADYLKGTDGEGWAIGRMVEDIIGCYGQSGAIQIKD